MRSGSLLALVLLSACRTATPHEPSTVTVSGPPGVIAATARAHGTVTVLDRADLSILHRVVSERGAPEAPMEVIATGDGVFLVGNLQGGLARIDPAGVTEALDLGGPLSGMALSPDGTRVAVGGAGDRSLRIVDLATFRETARVNLDGPGAAPPHTREPASTHPLWIDERHVVAQGGPALAIVDAVDGRVVSKVRVASPVHQVLLAGDRLVALADPAQVLVLARAAGELVLERAIDVPLAPDEPARLHQGLVTPGEGVVVVASMGEPHSRAGTTVAALDLRDGTVLWKARGPDGAGHVVALAEDRLLVAGHRSPELHVLDVASGRLLETWRLRDGVWPGHSIGVEPGGTVLVLDRQGGHVIRAGPQGEIARSPHLGGDVNEASFGE